MFSENCSAKRERHSSGNQWMGVTIKLPSEKNGICIKKRSTTFDCNLGRVAIEAALKLDSNVQEL